MKTEPSSRRSQSGTPCDGWCEKIEYLNLDGLVKSRKYAFSVIPAKLVLDLIGERESSDFRWFWMPAFAGMTGFGTFYECVKIDEKLF